MVGLDLDACLFVECVSEYLGVEDLLSVGAVSKHWRSTANTHRVWKRLCGSVWGAVPEADELAFDVFTRIAADNWKYRSCYAAVNGVWDRFKAWTAVHSPELGKTLNGPASEEALDVAEAALGHPLPLDVRCFYKIHNGQALPSHSSPTPLPLLDGTQEDEWAEEYGRTYHPYTLGLFGAWSAYNQHDCLWFLSAQQATQEIKVEGDIRYFPVGRSWLTQPQYLCIQTQEHVGNVKRRPAWSLSYSGPIGQCPHAANRSLPRNDNYFLAGHSLLGYFRAYVSRLEQGVYRARLGQIQLFPCGGHMGSTVTETNGVVIEASPLLVPSQSSVHRLTFIYRITMSSKTNACQLHTRTWKCRDNPEAPLQLLMHDTAVIGFYPMVGPDHKPWEYCSATNTNGGFWGQMGGSLGFVPGTLQEPQGPEFEAEIKPMTLEYNERAIIEATEWDLWADVANGTAQQGAQVVSGVDSLV